MEREFVFQAGKIKKEYPDLGIVDDVLNRSADRFDGGGNQHSNRAGQTGRSRASTLQL